MKKLFILISIFFVLRVNAQDYLINFAGTKGPVDIVIVENLSTGEILTLTGNDVLNLRGTITGINDNQIIQGIKIYPNPLISTNNTTILINPPSPGDAVIAVYDMSGRQIAQMKSYLENSTQEFRISNVNKGFYFVSIRAVNYQLSGKIVSNRNSGGQTSIEKINSNLTFDVKELKSTKGAQNKGIIVMSYLPGDRIKFTAISGKDRTTLTDIPDRTKTINFELLSITDGDNNNYHAVEMGEQIWLEENLKTTKYKDGTSVPMVSDNIAWSNLSTPGYSWYDHNQDSYKDPYGALYNGFTIGTGKICPTGWHVPTVDEWISMTDYLTVNGFGYHGDQLAIAKSLASKSGWNVPQSGGGYPIPEGAVGKDPQYNNSSGFNGFPGGIRGIDGTFSGNGYTGVWYSASGTSSLSDFGAYNSGVNLQQGDDNLTAGFSIRCIKGETKTLPNLITTQAYNVTQTSAESGATYAGEGESPVTSRGVCWNTTGNKYPTIDDNKTSDGTGTQPFTSLLTGLIPGTVYYVRSYAVTSDGIAYGTLDVFTTKIADADGNIYNTLYLKDKIWMVENLKTTRYNDGTTIPLVTDNTAWSTLSASGYCYYNNDEITNKSVYGGLYNWHAVNTGKLCPIDWHVPTDAEWTDLVNFMAGDTYAGGRLKETGTEHWMSPNAEATNDKGFTALPGGSRDTYGSFNNIAMDGTWWSSTEYNADNSLYRNMNYYTGGIIRNYNKKSNGFSVRCIKNGN